MMLDDPRPLTELRQIMMTQKKKYKKLETLLTWENTMPTLQNIYLAYLI